MKGGCNGGREGGLSHNGKMSLSPAIRKLRPDGLQQPTPNRTSTSDLASYVTSTALLRWCSVSVNGDVGLSASTPNCELQNDVNEPSTGSTPSTTCVSPGATWMWLKPRVEKHSRP